MTSLRNPEMTLDTPISGYEAGRLAIKFLQSDVRILIFRTADMCAQYRKRVPSAMRQKGLECNIMSYR
ncbi:MAG: hypothetical protein ACI4B5_03050 [Bacteroidaceae bacterium]